MKIGIIGAGTMGSGIAQTFAQTEGFEVYLTDLNLEIANAGLERIKSGLNKRLERGKIAQEEVNNIISRITICLKEELGDCDLVVEAALEDMGIKKATFQELDSVCKKSCIFASNTSSLSITEIGYGLEHPFIGMHFFNPAPVMKLVEVIPGLNTPEETVDQIISVAKAIGKTPVRVEEAPGFVVNRLLIPMVNEAIGLLAEGVAKAEDIDTAMQLGANHPMGPLALGDLIGLDVCLAIMEVLFAETADSKYRPHPLLRKMVRANKLGRKTGQGFFSY